MKNERILLGLLLLGLVKSVFFSHFGFGLVDEGESLHNAQRILSGELPYRDFFAIFPPLDNYFYAIIFWIFGESVVIPRIVASLIFAFVPVLLFLIGKRIMPRIYALLPALLIIFLDVNIERLYFFTPVLLGFYLFLKDRFFLSGFFLGLASLIRLDITGTFLFGAVTGPVLSYWVSQGKDWVRQWFVQSLKTGLGYALPIAALLFWLIKQGILSSFLEQAFIQPVVITSLHSLPFPSPSDLVPGTFSLAGLSQAYGAAYGYSLLLVYLAVVALLLKEGKRMLRKSPETVMLLLSGLIALPYVFGRSDIGHMVKGGIPFLVLGAYLLYQVRARFHFLLTSVLWLLVFGVFLINIAQSVWWLEFNNQKVELDGYRLRVNGEYVEGSTIPSAQTLQETVAFVRENTAKDEPVLLLPYMAGLYFLTDRPSPTKFNNVLAGFINSKEGESEFIKKVEESGVRVVVYDPENGPKMKTRRLQDYNPLIHNYLLEKFEIIEKTQEGWLLMEKKK